MSLSLPPPPNLTPIADGEVKIEGKKHKLDTKTNPTWSAWLVLLQQTLNKLIPSAGVQVAIQWKDEGSNLGAAGTADTVNFVGPNITTTRAGDTVTVTNTNQTETLTGDVTGTGTTSIVTTLATVNSNVGTFGDGTHVAQVTVNGKGLTTAVSNVLITGAPPTGTAGGDLSGTYPNPTVAKINGAILGTTTATSAHILVADGSAWQSVAVSGDQTISATGAVTFNTVNSNVGSFGSTTQVATFTVNGKGLITAAANASIAFPVTSVSGTANQVAVSPTTGAVVVSLAGPHNFTTLTAHSLVLGQGTSAETALGAATNGQIPIGSTGVDPVLATITAGTGITVTNEAGSITIAATGSSDNFYEASLVY